MGGGIKVLGCHAAAIQHSNKTVSVQVLGWVLSSAGGFFVVGSEVLLFSPLLVVYLSLRCLKEGFHVQ